MLGKGAFARAHFDLIRSATREHLVAFFGESRILACGIIDVLLRIQSFVAALGFDQANSRCTSRFAGFDEDKGEMAKFREEAADGTVLNCVALRVTLQQVSSTYVPGSPRTSVTPTSTPGKGAGLDIETTAQGAPNSV
jgi:hypothetical protein